MSKKIRINTNVNPEIEAYLEGHFPVKHEDFRDDETVQRPVRRVHRRDSEFRRIAKREARERYLMVKDIKRARSNRQYLDREPVHECDSDEVWLRQIVNH